MQFKNSHLTGEESDKRLTAVVQRSGDITHQSTVRCYTRQGSAQVASDFEERPNTDASIITFLPGVVFFHDIGNFGWSELLLTPKDAKGFL